LTETTLTIKLSISINTLLKSMSEDVTIIDKKTSGVTKEL